MLFDLVRPARRRQPASCRQGIRHLLPGLCTDKKEKKILLIYKEVQMGSVAKSYMRKGLLIYEEMLKYSTIFEEAVVIYDCATDPF
jgi:hypothetical protein